MPLEEGQWQVGDLVLGPGTAYRLMDETNPFTLTVRSDQSGDRAWNHGAWSGAEWANQRVVPLRILVDSTPQAEESELAAWLAAHQQLAAAFAPVGDQVTDVQLRFRLGDQEFLLLGRPRMVEPDLSLAATGRGFTRAAFVALDPRIYSAVEHVEQIGLPAFEGGLTIPLTVPFVIGGVLVDGRVDITNAGTTDTGLLLRIDGPVETPRVALQRPDGVVHRLRFDMDLNTGQFLLVDTAARTVFLNGLPQASQRGRAVGEFPLLPPGTSTLRFNHSGPFNEIATLGVAWRDAWW